MAGPSFVVDGLRWWVRADADPAAAEALVHLARSRVDAARPGVGAGARKRLYWLALGRPGAADHLLKIRGDAALRPRRVSKARRELTVAEGLAARGVPVARPLAAGERRRGGRVVESWLLVPLLEDFADLGARLRAGDLDAGARRAAAAALGGLAARAHDAGLHLDDLTPTNVLVHRDDPGELRLVDFERARLGRGVGAPARARMLAKLERALGEASAAERLRFLRAYAGGDVAAARRWWDRVAEAAAALGARDERRLARAARAAGRRFRPVATADWRGLARADASLAGIGEAAAREPGGPAEGFRVAARGELWDLHYPAISSRSARALFARTNALFERGLAPRPLALLRRGSEHRILCERRETAAGGGAERAAVARLLERLAHLGELEASLSADVLARELDRRGRLRARLVAPHAFRFARGGPSPPSRRRAARVLEELGIDPPPAPGRTVAAGSFR